MADSSGGAEVVVKFGGQIDDLKSKIGEVQGLFKGLTSQFAAMAAVVAGGAAFKSFIDEANAINGAAMKLSKTLGISGEEAATLNTALGDIYSDADSYTGAFLKFNRALRSSSDDMKALGLDVEAFKSGQKTSNDLFMDAVKIIGTYKAGIDQSQVAQKFFGKSVEDAMKFLKLNAQVLEDARKKNVELNLTISQEGVEASKKYKAAMNDVGDVLTGLKKTIGEAVIPLFTESANVLASIGPALVEGTRAAAATFVSVWNDVRTAVMTVFTALTDGVNAVSSAFADVFGTQAPSAMQIFKNALALVAGAFIIARHLFEQLFNGIRTGLQLLGNGFVGWAATVERALAFDFAGARAAWRQTMEERERILAESTARAVEISERGKADIERALVTAPLSTPSQGTPVGAPKQGTKTAAISDTAGDAKAAALAAARLALEKAQTEAALSLQREYLSQAQAIYDDAYAKNLLTTQQYYDARLAIGLRGIDSELAAKRKEMVDVQKLESTVKDPVQKLKAQAQETALLGQINVLEAKRNELVRATAVEYKAAAQARSDALANTASSAKKGSGDSKISDERSSLDTLKQLRQISAEDAFKIQADLEQRAYALTQESLAQKQTLVRGDVQKQADLNAEIEAAEREHANRMNDINRQASVESMRFSVQAQEAIGQSFSTMINGLLSGVTKVSDVFRAFGIQVANIFTNLIAQEFTTRLFGAGTAGGDLISSFVQPISNAVDMVVRKFILGETSKTAAETTGIARRKSIETTAAAQSVATTEGVVVVHEIAETTKTGAAIAGAAVRETTDVAAATVSVATAGESAIANIAARAWEAAAGVYAALAAIPYIGPFIAPAAAIAAGAVVLGFASRIVSSAGGDDQVSADRLNLVHKDETILSRPFATGLRKLVGEGGLNPVMEAVQQIRRTLAPDVERSEPLQVPTIEAPSGVAAASRPNLPTSLPGSLGQVGRINAAATPSVDQVTAAQAATGSRAGDVHLSVNAIDAQGVQRWLMQNGRGIAKSLQNQGRNFVSLKPT